MRSNHHNSHSCKIAVNRIHSLKRMMTFLHRFYTTSVQHYSSNKKMIRLITYVWMSSSLIRRRLIKLDSWFIIIIPETNVPIQSPSLSKTYLFIKGCDAKGVKNIMIHSIKQYLIVTIQTCSYRDFELDRHTILT